MSEDQEPVPDAIEQEYNEKILKSFSDQQALPIINPTSLSPDKDILAKQRDDENKLPEEFDLKYVGDLSYLQEIFSSKYDKFNSLDYLKKVRQSMLEEGYPDCSALNEFLFWATMSRKLQIIYQRMHAKLNRKKGTSEDDAENISWLKEMRNVSEQVASLQRSLEGMLDKRKKIKDVTDLHAETMEAAESFIKSHIGEFTFRCTCGAIVNTQGLPSFAIKTTLDNNGETIYHVFSPELWYLYHKQLIPLHYVAFVLRTSPEGILVTAAARGEYGVKPVQEDVPLLEKEESFLKDLQKVYDDYYKEHNH